LPPPVIVDVFANPAPIFLAKITQDFTDKPVPGSSGMASLVWQPWHGISGMAALAPHSPLAPGRVNAAKETGEQKLHFHLT